MLTQFSYAAGGDHHAPRADLSSNQRWLLTAGAVLLHGIVAIVVWHSSTLPALPPEPAPLMVSLITDDAVQLAPQAPPTVKPPEPVPVPKPVVQLTPQKAPPVLASKRTAEPQDMQVPVNEPEPRPVLAEATPTPVQNTPNVSASAVASTAPSMEPSVPPQPKTLPSSAVRFLIKPQPVYSAASLELGESGTVTMLILVDEQGRTKEVQVTKSSGYPRLDRAAVAAERAARFQPYLEAGVPRSVWVPHSITFNLEER